MRLDFHKNHRLLFGVVTFGFIGLSYMVAVGPAISVQADNAPLPGRGVAGDDRRRHGLSIAESTRWTI